MCWNIIMGKHTLIAPWAAAICDRGFSEQNNNVTKRRTCILTPVLRDLMMICLNGPHWNEHEKLLDILMRALRKRSVGKRYDD